MRKGEWGILGGIAFVAVAAMTWKAVQVSHSESEDYRIPFFSTASHQVESRAAALMKEHRCKSCHTLWSTRDMMRAVPAPALDGIGSLRTEDWLYGYISAETPQDILPSRLKPEFRMPSFSALPEQDRRVLAAYLAGLKVEDWYLPQAKKAEYEKLTGKEYQE